MNRSWSLLVVIVAILVALLCCLCLVASGIVGVLYFQNVQSIRGGDGSPAQTLESTPVVVRPTPGSENTQVSEETLKALKETVVPENDLPDLAKRLEGKQNIPATVEPPPASLEVGAQQEFWVTNVDTNENFRISATLRYVTDHVYFWIQDEVPYEPENVQALAETFENQIYPTNREFFGSEWTPGIDGDPHLYILYARGLGYSLAGYFSTSDEYHPMVHEYSNAHEMFLLNADNLRLDEEYTYSTLAHEFQHMIHWYRDRNEESWINEGFSELASFLNGYDTGGFDAVYMTNPDIQLTYWPTDENTTAPHYGAAFLFMTYFLDRFGEQATKALVANPTNGMDSIDQVLVEVGAVDTMRGIVPNADDVFVDWVLANYLQDASVGDGRYTYYNYSGAPRAGATETVKTCPSQPMTRDVRQYGVDYIRITCPGHYTLHFEGSLQVNTLPVDPYSGKYAFWSNRGDESDMTLTRLFDFSNYQGNLTLTYRTWYDLEEDYDYLYLEASPNGETWQILTTPSGTDEDPSGNSFGWGYNGASGGWIEERVDLSAFAGKKVWLRFEYVTDAAVNGEGFLLEDVAIPEIGYFTDFESDEGGWQSNGWVRIQNVLPQTFRLALISFGNPTTVEYLSISPDNSVEVPLVIGEDVREAVLVVTATNRYTRQPAGYRFEIRP